MLTGYERLNTSGRLGIVDSRLILAGSRAVADSIVIDADEDARAANLYHWFRAKPWLEPIHAQLRDCGDSDILTAATDLRAAPADPVQYWQFCTALETAAEAKPDVILPILELGMLADRRIRISHHIGADYQLHQRDQTRSEALHTAMKRGWGGVGRGKVRRDGTQQSAEDVAVLVVIPFRDREGDGVRTLNLLACLEALRDQDPDTVRTHVIVVETDDQPRSESIVAPQADQYVFAMKEGGFNKSWAVNVGVCNASCTSDVICILDADVLVDAKFIHRNYRRFSRAGTGSFIPYRDICYLDDVSTTRAIWSRCVLGARRLDPEVLRGFLIRRPPGGCVWMRRDVFDAICGMDERYEGWGGEDLDLLLRLFRAGPLHFFDDPTVHLHHPPSSDRIDGTWENAHLQFMTWSPDDPIGRIDKFAPTASDEPSSTRVRRSG